MSGQTQMAWILDKGLHGTRIRSLLIESGTPKQIPIKSPCLLGTTPFAFQSQALPEASKRARRAPGQSAVSRWVVSLLSEVLYPG